MQRRRFGRTGLEVPALTYGGGFVGGYILRSSEAEANAILDRAVRAGIDWIDTAASYGNGTSETVIGRWLKARRGQRPRLSTKFNIDVPDGDFHGQIRRSIEASYGRLGLDHVEVVILHNRIVADGTPGRDKRDLTVSEVLGPGGVADLMDYLRKAGLTDHIGITGLGDPAALAEVVASGRFDVMQAYYNMLNPTGMGSLGPGWTSTDFDGLMRKAVEADMGLMGIRIFAAGHLATDERHGREIPITANAESEIEEQRTRAVLAAVGEGYGTRAQAAVRFGLACPALSTIVVGIGAPSHLEEAIEAERLGPLPTAAIEALDQVWRSDPAFRA